MYGDDGVEGKIFFTKEGKSLGWAFDSGVVGRLYPAAGAERDSGCTANWGKDMEKRPYLWEPANTRRLRPEDVRADMKEEKISSP